MLSAIRTYTRPLLARNVSVGLPSGRAQVSGAKRFYDEVTVCRCSEEDAWEIQLDGRTLKTPTRRPLHFPNAALAHAVALEWDAQDGSRGIDPHAMPMMTIVCTAIDNEHDGLVQKKLLVEQLMPFLDTDTVCYFAKDDHKLLRKQQRLWKPLHEWLAAEHGVTLSTNTEVAEIVFTPHPQDSVQTVRSMLEAMDIWTITGVHALALECKSLVIPLALQARYITVEQAIAAARVDEEDQIERWGLVEGGHDVDRVNADVSVASSSMLLWWLGSDDE